MTTSCWVLGPSRQSLLETQVRHRAQGGSISKALVKNSSCIHQKSVQAKASSSSSTIDMYMPFISFMYFLLQKKKKNKAEDYF